MKYIISYHFYCLNHFTVRELCACNAYTLLALMRLRQAFSHAVNA